MPPPEIRRLRDLTRVHRIQTEERTRVIQRLANALVGSQTRPALRATLDGPPVTAAIASEIHSRAKAK